jgi:hypothetical protein
MTPTLSVENTLVKVIFILGHIASTTAFGNRRLTSGRIDEPRRHAEVRHNGQFAG